MAAQRLFNLRDAGFQRLPDVLQFRRGCGSRPLLYGLGQPDHLCFELLQAGIHPFLVGQAIHRLVVQGNEDAQADQPKPEQALHDHGGG